MTTQPVGWISEDRFFMVSERHDESDPSGVRRVRFVLQAPEVEMTIPELPDAIILPPQDTSTNPFDNSPYDPGGPGEDFPESEDCCDEPGTDIEEGVEPVPEEIVHTSPTDPPPDPPPPPSDWTVINWAPAGFSPNMHFDVEPFHYYLIATEGISNYAVYNTTGSVTVTEQFLYGPLFPSAGGGAGQYYVKWLTVQGDGELILLTGSGRGLDAYAGVDEVLEFLELDTDSVAHAAGAPDEELTITLGVSETADTMMLAVAVLCHAYFGTGVTPITAGGLNRPYSLYKEGGSANFGWTAMAATEMSLVGGAVLVGRP